MINQNLKENLYRLAEHQMFDILENHQIHCVKIPNAEQHMNYEFEKYKVFAQQNIRWAEFKDSWERQNYLSSAFRTIGTMIGNALVKSVSKLERDFNKDFVILFDRFFDSYSVQVRPGGWPFAGNDTVDITARPNISYIFKDNEIVTPKQLSYEGTETSPGYIHITPVGVVPVMRNYPNI